MLLMRGPSGSCKGGSWVLVNDHEDACRSSWMGWTCTTMLGFRELPAQLASLREIVSQASTWLKPKSLRRWWGLVDGDDQIRVAVVLLTRLRPWVMGVGELFSSVVSGTLGTTAIGSDPGGCRSWVEPLWDVGFRCAVAAGNATRLE